MDVLNAYVSTLYQIDNLWNIFMAAHVILFGALFKFREKLEIKYRIFLMLGYVVFAFMNMRALIIKYDFVYYMRMDILVMLAAALPSPPEQHLNLMNYLKEHTLGWRIVNVSVIHVLVGMAALFVSVEIELKSFFRRLFSKSYFTSNR